MNGIVYSVLCVFAAVMFTGCTTSGGGVTPYNGGGVATSAGNYQRPPAPETQNSATVQTPPPVENSSPQISADMLMAGQTVTVVFSGSPTPPKNHQERIREDGVLVLPLIGEVTAAGKTVGKLQEEIQSKYVPDYYKILTVTIAQESRFFSVKGMVRLPRSVEYVADMTVLKAIAAAGDFNDFAGKNKVKVIRSNGEVLIVDCEEALLDPSLDLPIYPGDIIEVPRRRF